MAESKTVEIGNDDLPLHCPPSGAPAWSLHPRVFLDIQQSGSAVCPYCGTHYVFKGDKPKGH